jgi:hypothetical protein
LAVLLITITILVTCCETFSSKISHKYINKLEGKPTIPILCEIASIESKIMAAKSFADLPDTIFCNIIECLGWCEVARFDTAVLDRNMRKCYLVALKLRKVKVERNWFWRQLVGKGILNWLVSRNIRVVSWDSKVDNTELMTIANGLPQLQSLDISECWWITDAGIIALATGCTQLQSLDIRGCHSITDEGIRAVATGCTQLQSLNISGTFIKITDAGITAVAGGCPQLRSLNISYCGNITDAGIRALATGCSQLQSLDIYDCQKITDAGIRALASGCPQLQSLNMSRCYNMTDAGIEALASGCPQLQSLDMRRCGNITDEGITALATGCSQLQSLNISECRNITDAGREIAERINSRK